MPQAIEVIGGDYEHTLGLVGIHDGIDVRYTTAPLHGVFLRMVTERCYEACEFSLSNYLMLKDRGADWLHAIPVFPYRAFRHSTLYVRNDSPLREPAELRGKRAGVPDFSMTAAVWTRGILADQYGVQWQDLRWVVSGNQRFATLPGVTLEATNGDLEAMLVDGTIDALLTPQTADGRKPANERKLRSLIADAQAAEESYLRTFGIYPINHVVVIRSEVLQRLPGLPLVLFEAYEETKARAYAPPIRYDIDAVACTALEENLRPVRRGFAVPYGFNDLNRTVVGTLARFLHEQKLIERPPDLQKLFLSV